MTHRRNLAAAVAAVSVLAGATAAFAADTTPTPTQVTVTPVTTLHAGDKAPGDAPGVKAIRRGKTIAAGYELPGQKVDITRGSKAAGASLRFQCPGHKRLRSFLTTGHAGFEADRAYVNHRATFVSSFPGFAGGATHVSGIVYAVCR